jgi:hypothetical protein
MPIEPSEPPKPARSSLRDLATKPVAIAPAEHASHPYDAKSHAKARFLTYPDDFAELELPATAAHPISVLVFLGLPHGARPFQGDDDDDELDSKGSPARRAWALERSRSLFCKLQVQPGERFMWPKTMVSALVNLNNDGQVVGGLAPSIRAPGESLEMHPSLEVESADTPFAVPGPQQSNGATAK